MSLFDPPNMENLDEAFPEGTPFMLYKAEFEGMISTEFGSRAAAMIEAGAADRTGDTKEFRVFGALAEAVKRMERDDLPALVSIVREGRAKRWQNVAATRTDEDSPF